MKDTRQQGKVWHQLTDILFIVTAGVMCGYDEMDDIYIWANANSSQEWLKKYISLANGMPSLSTIRRAFTIIDPKEFLGISPAMLRKILDAYFEAFGIILPTAGPVLDMGRTLIHKKIVVEMALSGLNTQEIADRIYHTPVAVDN